MKRLILLSLAVAPALGVMAQSHPVQQAADKSVTLVGPGQNANADSIAATLHKNAPKKATSTGVPNFALVGKNSNFVMAVGGALRTTVSMDLGHPISSPDMFTTSAIPMGRMHGNNAQYNMSAQQSNLYVNMLAKPGTANEVGVYIQANFLNNYAPVLQFAYMNYRGIQAGYNYTLFSDPAAIPPTIDYEGPNAITSIPVATLNYSVNFGKNKEWKAAIGAELPMPSYTTRSVQTSTVSQRVPDIPAAIQYSWAGGNSWLRLSGVLRNLYYRDLVAQKNVDKVGWGVQLSGSAALAPGLTAYYEGVYGKGIASFIQDMNGLGLDLTPKGIGTDMEAVKAWGAYGGLQYNLAKNVYGSTTYSHVRGYADQYAGGSTPWSGQYKWAQYVVSNVFWNVTSYFQTGVEYLWGRRADYSNAKSADTRIQAMVQLSF